MGQLNEKFPRLVLGDHGFLPQYGSKLTRLEVIERMRLALSNGITALAAGERFVSDAVIESFGREKLPPVWVRHVDLPLLLQGQKLDLSRAFSTTRATAERELQPTLMTDPVMGPFFDAHRHAPPYSSADCRTLEIDPKALGALEYEICSLRPQLITFGGDVLDFAISCNRQDLITECFSELASAAAKTNASLYLCTYIGFAMRERFDQVLSLPGIDGFMLTVNSAGGGMLPSSKELLAAVAESEKQVAAMHVLLFGKLAPASAIKNVLSIPNVRTAIVGASRPENILALSKAADQINTALR